LKGGSYPNSVAELAAWRQANHTTMEEARRRLVQFVVLASIASSRELVNRLALKGGNALHFVHGNTRSTLDLDFTAETDFPDNADEIRTLLDRALRGTDRRFQVKTRCQSVNRNPKRSEATCPTYTIKICFQLPLDRYYQNFDERKHFAEVVELEISLNDTLCETLLKQLSPATILIRVCSLEDILAEKLRALLQQTIRNRNRPQDVYDIASRVRDEGATIDVEKVSEFLIQKSKIRQISPRKSSYNDEVRDRARYNYESEIDVPSELFIPFDGAWEEVIRFVNRLTIPG
jgi:predicted nucleotidyltransferase component of viral defense system